MYGIIDTLFFINLFDWWLNPNLNNSIITLLVSAWIQFFIYLFIFRVECSGLWQNPMAPVYMHDSMAHI